MHRPWTRTLLLAAFAVVALCLPASSASASPTPSDPEAFESVTVKRYLMGRVKPTISARGAAHLWTNTGFSNRRMVYPVWARKVHPDGSEWLKVTTLRGRRQVDVWIPKWATRRVLVPYRVKIDVSARRVTVYRLGQVKRRFRVVVGSARTPTPTGRFFIMDRMHLRDSWARGGWALALSAFSRVLKTFNGGQGQIAMHTKGSLSDPLGTARSNGCIRLADRDIRWMAAHVPNGTPVWVQR